MNKIVIAALLALVTIGQSMEEGGFLLDTSDNAIAKGSGKPGINKVIYDFIQGIFDGLKRKKDKSECFNDSMLLMPLLFQRIDECIEKTKAGREFFEVFMEQLPSFGKDLEPIYTVCRLDALQKALNEPYYDTTKRMIKNQSAIFAQFIKLVDGFKINRAEAIGKALAIIFYKSYDFYVL